MAEENERSEKPSESMTAGDTGPRSGRRLWVRISMLIFGPAAVLLVGGYIYVNTGRYVETDNAYVKAAMVAVSSQVAGPIARLGVEENVSVKGGDVLLEIDDEPFRVAVERAEAQLETVRAFIQGLQASYQQALEQLKLAHTNVAFSERELARELSLAERELGSEADVDRARHEFDIATQQIPIIEQSLAQLRSQLGGNISGGLEGHAAYRAAKAMLEGARLELEHTFVRAPFAGVASKVPSPGTYAARGAILMGLVSDSIFWLEANFKETQLTNVEVGQPVLVRIDTYPGREWRGEVESISQATGAEFSVIPAQNASGNWVKVAQRITVRITLDVGPNDSPLRSGMSAIVEIDTGFERPAPAIFDFLRNK